MNQEQPENNPYQTPAADLQLPPSSTEQALTGPHKCSAAAGPNWFLAGWAYFKASPVAWILSFILYMALLIGLSLIPLLSMLSSLLVPVFVGGWMLGCKAIDDGEQMRTMDLFSGFEKHAGPLLLIGLFSLLAYVLLIILLAALGYLMLGGMETLLQIQSMDPANPALPVNPLQITLFVLLGLALSLPIMMAVWFSPALVVLHDLSAINAMLLSVKGCVKNIVPMFLYALVAMILMTLSAIPAFLGLLVTVPILIASFYLGYKAIFLSAESSSNTGSKVEHRNGNSKAPDTANSGSGYIRGLDIEQK